MYYDELTKKMLFGGWDWSVRCELPGLAIEFMFGYVYAVDCED